MNLKPMVPPIIERPDLQSWRQRFGYGLLTLLCWFLYAYLWLPLLSMLAWYAGVQVFYHHMVELEGYKGLLRLLGLYLGIIGAISAVYIGWALVNYWRFHGVERRRARPVATTEDIAEHFGLDPRALAAWRKAQVVVVHHDEQARIRKVEVRVGAPPTVAACGPPRGCDEAGSRCAAG